MVVGSSVTAVIPTHEARWGWSMMRALASVAQQTFPIEAVSIAVDTRREGAGATRDRALRAVETRWVAFLDSDDEWLPTHVEDLITCAEETGADVVYPECRVIHTQLGEIPRSHPGWAEWGRPGEKFNADILRRRSYIPVTSLVRTKLAQQSSFIPPPFSHYDDWGFYLGLLDLGAMFVHLPKITWMWHHGPHNTSGRPDRGDAK